MSNTLSDACHRTAGVVLLALLVAVWLSLASWSLQDPSLSHVTSMATRNLLGSRGAIVADLLIQALGLAVLAVLLPPMFWGVALVKCEPFVHPARRIGAYAVVIVTASLATASLPTPSVWPLHHGLGGIIGDAAVRLACAPFAMFALDFGRPCVGIAAALLCARFLVLSIASGRLDIHDLAATMRLPTRRTSAHGAGDRDSTRRIEPVMERTDRLSQRIEPVLAVNDGSQIPTRSHLDDDYPTSSAPPVPQTHRPVNQFGPYAAYEPEPIEDEFDEWTESASSGIAARFAPTPSPNGPHTLQDTLHLAFAAPEVAIDGTTQSAYQVLPPDTPARGTGASPQSATQRALTYKRPSLNLLERPRTVRAEAGYAASVLRGNARLLEDSLADFGVVGTVCDIQAGPVVTRYEFEAARGTNPGRVISLANDVARQMGVAAVRIAPMAGRSTFAVELPNQLRETIYLRDLFDAEAYRSTMDALPIALGKTAAGETIVACLTRMPNVLMAGASGSGKSVGLNAIILSLIYKHGPDNCRFLMIDPKMTELSVYDGIPHLLTPVVSDPHKAITALAWCVREMEERTKRMAALGVRSIDVFNNRVRNAKKRGERLARTVQTGFDQTGRAQFEKEEMSLEPLPYIVIVIEEFADLIAVAGKEIEGSVKRLADAARAAGIHLIMATERPSSDIVTGSLKANMPTRMTYKMASKVDSRVMLGSEGGEHLLGQGDMLYDTGGGQSVRIHGPYVSGEEVETIAESLRQQGEPRYVAGLLDVAEGSAPSLRRRAVADPQTARTATGPTISQDALYDRAVAIVVRDGRASTLHLGRRLNVSPAWAAGLLYRLEIDGIIGPPGPDGQCAVLVGAAA
jgi:DNA segregation ATPase FtsK/SpoIIIE, S-DNA-T family